MTAVQAIILGIIEGLTEFLPVSSTGHLILASNLLKIEQTPFLKSFEIAIQLGAILSVVVLYGAKVFKNIKAVKTILVSFLPTAIIGFVFYKMIKGFLGNEMIVLYSLFLGGVAIIIFELVKKQESVKAEISHKNGFLIGIFQSLAAVPGVSRSLATIMGGSFLKIERKVLVEFSFLLAVPTMLAATGYDLLKTAIDFSSQEFLLLGIGFAVSFVSAILVIKLFLNFVKKHSFLAFGIYRIIISVVLMVIHGKVF